MLIEIRYTFDFCTQDYQIDEESQEYISLHPMSSQKQPSLVEEHFEPVEDDDVSDYSDASAESQASEEEPDFDKDRSKKKSHIPR